jgi:hypothetical protein
VDEEQARTTVFRKEASKREEQELSYPLRIGNFLNALSFLPSKKERI